MVPSRLLDWLREAGADTQAAVLLARDPAAHVNLDDPRHVAKLLDSLREAGAAAQVTALAERVEADAASAWNQHLVNVNQHLDIDDHPDRFPFGREPDKRAAAPWTWDDLE